MSGAARGALSGEIGILIHRNCVLRNLIVSSRQQHNGNSTQITSPDINDNNEAEELQKLRDVSRLPIGLRNTPPIPLYRKHGERRYLRKLYASYGSQSNVDAAILWPTKEKLKQVKEDAAMFELTLQQRIQEAENKMAAEAEEKQRKRDHVMKQMEKMPTLIAAFKQKLVTKEEEEKKVEMKRHALLEEARDFFGYKIDPRDPRFVQMQEMKAEEELKQKKLRKKEGKKSRSEAT